MGFWDSWTSPKATNEDPLRDLDPSLREFLVKESPVKYAPTKTVLPSSRPDAAKSVKTAQEGPTTSPDSTSDQSQEASPSQSLYPDGRYAHLWKTYRPKSALDAESKSDQEKLQDVLDAYKDRRASIGQAAFENCSFEFSAIDECYAHGTWMETVMMCRKQKSAFDKCYTMQTKFLKALGYMSTFNSSPDIDEAIQMHADTLYHQVLEREEAIEEAKAAGRPAPVFTGLWGSADTNNNDSPPPPPSPSTPKGRPSKKDPSSNLPPLLPALQSRLTPATAHNMRKKLAEMTPLEQEIEQRAYLKEVEDARATDGRLREIRREKRQKQREESGGRSALGETFVSWFGWRVDGDDEKNEGSGRGGEVHAANEVSGKGAGS